MCEDLLPYFRDRLLMTAAKLQSWTDDVARSEDGVLDSESAMCDHFGKALLECIAGMPTEQVGVYSYLFDMLKFSCHVGWLIIETWHIPKDACLLCEAGPCPWTFA